MTSNLQAIVPESIHRAAKVRAAQIGTSIGHYIATLVAADLKIPAPKPAKRGAPINSIKNQM